MSAGKLNRLQNYRELETKMDTWAYFCARWSTPLIHASVLCQCHAVLTTIVYSIKLGSVMPLALLFLTIALAI